MEGEIRVFRMNDLALVTIIRGTLLRENLDIICRGGLKDPKMLSNFSTLVFDEEMCQIFLGNNYGQVYKICPTFR